MDNKEKSIATAQVRESGKHNSLHCPLCSSLKLEKIHRDAHCKIERDYIKCAQCDLIFVPSIYHLSPDKEKEVYDWHENNPNDPGYRKFLSRLSEPLVRNLTAGAKGLDFGSGPGPTLSLMLEEQGFNVETYDPYYSPNKEVLQTQYDFITSTEVVEHLSKPGEVFTLLFDLLKDNGILGLMTKRPPETGIENWHYTKDPTHITFYSEKTFEFLAEKYDCTLEVISDDTVLLTKA